MRIFEDRGNTSTSRRRKRTPRALHQASDKNSESAAGFTLVELLIVCAVTPLIIGALAIGLFSMFTLQSSVGNRLADSADSQAIQASFRTDVQSAAQITTSNGTSPQCGTGTQLLGLEWNENAATHVYQTVVSYIDGNPVTKNGVTTYSLIRQYCTVQSGTLALVGSTVVTSDLQAGQLAPVVTCTTATCPSASPWIPASDVTNVSFPIIEHNSNYQYTLVADPATSVSSTDTGGPITVTTTSGCGYASPGSGTYASSLCLIDFSSLTGNNLLAATQGCLETSVPLPGGSTMYYCIGLTGAPVAPSALPTWTDGFLGNSINGVPFYTDVPGNPGLYQNCEGSSSKCTVFGQSVTNTWGGKTVISITGITVVGPNGSPDTGWEFVSADAESSDSGESISWTSNATMHLIPNGQSVDTPSDPIGNACNSGANVTPQSVLTGGGSATITCNGYSDGTKTGTVMVEALTPTSMTVTLIGTGLEGASFGLLF